MGTVSSLVIYWNELSYMKRNKSDSFNIFEPRDISDFVYTGKTKYERDKKS